MKSESISQFLIMLVLPLTSLLGGLGTGIFFYKVLHVGHQDYTELLTGNMVWGQGLKNGEYAVIVIGLVVALLIYIGLTEIFHILTQRSTMAWGTLVKSSSSFDQSAERTFCHIGALLTALPLSAFSGFGFSLLLFRLFRVDASMGIPATKILIFIGMIACLAASSLVLLQRKKHEKKFLARIKIIALSVQCGLPLLFIYLIPPPPQSGTSPISVSPLLYVLVFLLTVLAYREIYIRIKSRNNDNSFLLFSPLALIATLLFINIPLLDAGWFPTDFYHDGEYLLPWKLWSDFGQLPYWDHAPARGIDNYLSAMFADLFFEPTAAGYVFGLAITATLYIGIVFFSLHAAIGSLPALLCLLLYPMPLYLHGLNAVCAAGFCYLFVSRNRYDLKLWPTIWILLGTFLVLYAPGQGALIVLATLPLGLYWLYEALKENIRHTLMTLCFVLVFAALILLVSPAGKMLLGAVRYGLEQVSINIIANGIPWQIGILNKLTVDSLLFETLRFSWLIAGFWAGCLAYRDLRYNGELRSRSNAMMGFSIFLLALLYIPRAAGRIDPGVLSRPWIASSVFLFIYLPLLLFRSRFISSKVERCIILLLLVILSIKVMDYRILGLPNLIYKPGFRLSSVDKLNDADDYGLPALGMTGMPRSKLEELSLVKQKLDAFIKPGETYLDLTSRNAHYFIFDYPSPIETAAVYNLISRGQQDRSVRKLKENPPPVAYAWPATLHDGGPTSLRSHRVSRYVIENYTPFSFEEHIFYARPERLSQINATGLGLNVPDNRLELDHKVFWLPHMKGLPLSWGKSFDTLAGVIEHIQGVPEPTAIHHVAPLGEGHYVVNGKDPHLVFDLSSLEISGNEAGLLLVEVQSKVEPDSKEFMEVFWANQLHGIESGYSVKFDWDNAKMLVPLDSVPSWILGGRLMKLRVDLPRQKGAVYTIKSLSLWQRQEYAGFEPN